MSPFWGWGYAPPPTSHNERTWVEVLAVLGAHVDEEDLGLLEELAGQQLLQRQVRA